MIDEKLVHKVIGEAIQVHRALGPGLLENVYKECLFHTLVNEGISVRKEVAIPVIYQGVKLDCGYRADLLIEGKLIIEIKSVEVLGDIHLAQVLTYLKLGGFKLGLLINFNTVVLKNGIKRVVN